MYGFIGSWMNGSVRLERHAGSSACQIGSTRSRLRRELLNRRSRSSSWRMSSGEAGATVAGVIPEALRASAPKRLTELGTGTIVVKYGGAAMASEELKMAVIQDVVTMRENNLNVILVHGGGPDVNKMLTRVGIETVFKNGLRVTDGPTMEVAEMVLAGKVNKSIVSLVSRINGRAVGLCGKDGKMVTARQKNADLGYVGEIVAIDPHLLNSLTAAGYIPIVSSIAQDENGVSYNINADTLAGRIASEMQAQKLILMTDVPGVMKDPKVMESLYKSLSMKQVDELIEEGIIHGGMIPKVRLTKLSVIHTHE